jgi:hypothetical protein
MSKSGIVAAAVAAGLFVTAAHAATSATAQVTLNSITAGPTYNYTIALDDTGTTNIGTFWFGWVPGQDFLTSEPSAVVNPTGFADVLTGSHNSSDGTAIQWQGNGNTADFLTPGETTDFGFSTADSPTVLAGISPSHPPTLETTSVIYAGGTAFSGTSGELVASVAVPEPTTLGLFFVGSSLLTMRRRKQVAVAA